MPPDFTWIDKPTLAALSRPGGAADLAWLRREKIDIVLTLTEDPLPRAWVNEAGLMAVHLPVPDFDAPSELQLRQATDTVSAARRAGMGVAVHCLGGKGRTGTVLAAILVSQGRKAADAIRAVRALRPGSIESAEQEQAVFAWERRYRAAG